MSTYDDMLRELKKQHQEDLEFEKIETRFAFTIGFLIGLLIGIIVTTVFF